MEPLAWTGAHKVATASLSLGTMFMGIATDQWIVIASGLGIGVLARTAYLLSLKKPVFHDLIVSLIMAPMNGALAAEMVESIALHNARLLVATSLLASSSTMIFVESRKHFLRWKGVDEKASQVFTGSDTTVHIPQSAHAVDVVSVGKDAPQTTAEVALAHLATVKPITDHGADLAAMLRKLDVEE